LAGSRNRRNPHTEYRGGRRLFLNTGAQARWHAANCSLGADPVCIYSYIYIYLIAVRNAFIRRGTSVSIR